MLRDGDGDDDTVADITNRKMAKLYMVSSLSLSSVVYTGLDAAGGPVSGGTLFATVGNSPHLTSKRNV